jgi:arsenate reductase
MNKPKVLFLCTGYSARSQMAEAFLRTYAGKYFDVYSAGIKPRGFILPEVMTVMKERGLDLEGQFSKSINEYLGKYHFAFVITVCANAEKHCPTVFLNMGQHMHWPFEDPAESLVREVKRLSFLRDLRDKIDQRIQLWLVTQDIQLITL